MSGWQVDHFGWDDKPTKPAGGPIGGVLFPEPADFAGRFAAAWDGRGGGQVFAPPTDHLALLRMSGLPDDLAGLTWRSLTGAERERLLFGARRAIGLGELCAWALGR